MLRSLLLALAFLPGCGLLGGGGGVGDVANGATPDCVGNECVCADACDVDCDPSDTCEVVCSDDCNVACQDSPDCDVQGGKAEVDVDCSGSDSCQVECSKAERCAVDCQGVGECTVTCPTTGCTVSNCAQGEDCAVTCGLAGIGKQQGSDVVCE
jgi:hypothetical protein